MAEQRNTEMLCRSMIECLPKVLVERIARMAIKKIEERERFATLLDEVLVAKIQSADEWKDDLMMETCWVMKQHEQPALCPIHCNGMNCVCHCPSCSGAFARRPHDNLNRRREDEKVYQRYYQHLRAMGFDHERACADATELAFEEMMDSDIS